MNKRILILGKGFLGESLRKELNCRIDGSLIDSLGGVEKLIEKHNPKVIINCIGAAGARNVDDCELEKDNVLLANSFIPVILAEAAVRNNIKLVHISSGCIFNFDYQKDAPLKEDSRNYFFKLFYSRSKIYGETAIAPLSRAYDILIVRIRIPLLNFRHPKNILDKLIKYKNIIDLPNSVTYLPDFMLAIKHLIKINARGVYNVVNKGGLRYPALMRIYQKYVPSFKFKVIAPERITFVRTNLLLSVRKLEKTGFKIRNINSVLEECVKEYLKS